MNPVVIPSPDRKTSPGGPEPVPEVRTTCTERPLRWRSTPAPRARERRSRFVEGSGKKRACFDFRGKLQVSEAFRKRSGTPHARSERAASASGPQLDTRPRRRDERMSSREICKYYLHGARRNGASCPVQRDNRANRRYARTTSRGTARTGISADTTTSGPRYARRSSEARSGYHRPRRAPSPPHTPALPGSRPRPLPPRRRHRLSPRRVGTPAAFGSAFFAVGVGGVAFFALSRTRTFTSARNAGLRRLEQSLRPPPRQGPAGASGAPSMNTGAREFVPGGGSATPDGAVARRRRRRDPQPAALPHGAPAAVAGGGAAACTPRNLRGGAGVRRRAGQLGVLHRRRARRERPGG